MKRKAKARSKSDKSPATSPIVLRQLKELKDWQSMIGITLTARVLALELKVQRLIDGHSGDPAAHAALAPNVEPEQPTSEAAPVTDAPAEQGT